jgi:acetoin utilization protein AcuB
MTIGRRMTHNPITIKPNTPVTEAQNIMRREKIHRLPVVGKHDTLVGIVTEKDLLYASPSPASTLNVYEMTHLLAKLTVDKVMSGNVITVEEDTLLEDAARIMSDNNIGGLPVTRKGLLVGIITESDIFKILIEVLGARDQGVRVTTIVPEKPGELLEIAKAIFESGGNIISLGTFLADDSSESMLTLKVEGISTETLCEKLEPLVDEIIDVRET